MPQSRLIYLLRLPGLHTIQNIHMLLICLLHSSTVGKRQLSEPFHTKLNIIQNAGMMYGWNGEVNYHAIGRSQCARSYLVVDRSKFGKQSMTWINQLEDYTGVITDRKFTLEELQKIHTRGVKIIEAKPEEKV